MEDPKQDDAALLMVIAIVGLVGCLVLAGLWDLIQCLVGSL